MSGHTVAARGPAGGDLRARILADPDLVLGDPALMRALVRRAEGGGAGGGKVVDLRAVAMARLEARLGRLEAAHRTVIAAAYENLAGTQQVHRAILRLLDAGCLASFVDGLSGEVAAILRLDVVRLVIESSRGALAARGPPPGRERPHAPQRRRQRRRAPERGTRRLAPPGAAPGAAGVGLGAGRLRRGAARARGPAARRAAAWPRSAWPGGGVPRARSARRPR